MPWLRQRLCHVRFERTVVAAKHLLVDSCGADGTGGPGSPDGRPCSYSEREITDSKSPIPNPKLKTQMLKVGKRTTEARRTRSLNRVFSVLFVSPWFVTL